MKNKPKWKSSWSGSLEMLETVVFLTAGLLLLLQGTEDYWIGFHNSDAGLNMFIIQGWTNLTLCDHASDGSCLTPTESVVLGRGQEAQGLHKLIGGGIIFGMGIVLAISNKKVSK